MPHPVFFVEFLSPGDWCCIACQGTGTVSAEDDLRVYVADCEECCGTGWVSVADFESYGELSCLP